MTWSDDLRAQVPRSEIPLFLAELQALVAALREDREWQHLLTPPLRAHAELAIAYLQAGKKRDAVAAAMRAE